jgi:hypothetical protein
LTSNDASALTIVAFGDLDAGLWGVVWGTQATAFALRAADTELGGPATIEATGDVWSISADDLRLTVSPVGEVVVNETLGGFDQLCRVTGTVGTDVSVEGLGRRGSRNQVELDAVQSIRDVSCWFAPDRGLALTAVRPRKTRGHDQDLLAAAILDLEAEHPVAEPRLSTTYALDGRPARAGLELWLQGDEESEQQYPTRAAGELAGEGVRSTADGLEVLAEPFRWHSRGADGTGVYLLMRPR